MITSKAYAVAAVVPPRERETMTVLAVGSRLPLGSGIQYNKCGQQRTRRVYVLTFSLKRALLASIKPSGRPVVYRQL